MEEGDGGGGGGWLKWLLIVPLCAAGGALLARYALHRGPAPAPAVTAPAAQAAPRPEPQAAAVERPAAPAAQGSFELQSDEFTTGEAGVVWGGAKPAASTAPAQAAAAAAAPPADPARAKKDAETGFMYGALTKMAGKLLDKPGALTALFNNDFVVKGFMSRDTVKQATASKASLAAYLSNPANISKFMSKAPVQEGLQRPELLKLMAGTKMATTMMDTPGGKALLSDPAAIAQVVRANPEIAVVLSNPAVVAALMSNPKTAGIAMQGMGGPRK